MGCADATDDSCFREPTLDSTEIISENDSVIFIEGIGFIHLNVEVINHDEEKSK